MSDTLVLAGDIGGTKSSLAFFRGSPNAPEAVTERVYRNHEFASLAEVVGRFHADTGLTAATACFGVAGAVLAGASHLPNLDWELSETDLAVALKLGSVRLLNDLEANAHGIRTLEPEQFFKLNPGSPHPGGNQALIAAGTGLGMALLLHDGPGYRVSASEGGHADFAPRNQEEVGLWQFLTARFGRVSVERVVSGRGIEAIYDFLKDGGMAEPDGLAMQLEGAADRAAVIAKAGMSGEAAICAKALDMFLSAYGAAAGNLALMALATGGLYIGGGIAPRLIDAFPMSGFMAALKDKGRFGGLLGQIPVQIILEPRTALYGAAACALRQCVSKS
ncbi:glucokinase [Thiobacillus sp.]|uniref:glucokinase n=1 Tax=Thiobacillus sp. TaxID=924 RepID=UPI0025EF8123|nr:glucokinase [Thiobacillus sp.]